VDNPGAISDTQMATAEIGSSGASSAGTFTYKESRAVTAEVGGEVVSIPVKEGDTVGKNATLVVLESSDVSDSVTSAANQVRNSQLSLENKYDQLDSYTVKSPIQGTVIEKNYKQGDTIESGESLCTVYDLSYLKVTLNVDELDISSIEEGQKVTITADAVEDKVYEGVVTSITMMGTTSNGVTTYPVEIQITETEGLLPGMNVSTEILIENAENVVTVPISAVEKGNRVLVKGGEIEATGEGIPNGYGYREVEVGVSDDSYIEIVSGIEEGEMIAYMQISMNDSEETQRMPGGGSGMPSGAGGGSGMPGGGGGAPGGGGGAPGSGMR
ncbi:MAG: efflux RND transporter periplasmic adaptor subunit, partial [Anaerotignum sp.]